MVAIRSILRENFVGHDWKNLARRLHSTTAELLLFLRQRSGETDTKRDPFIESILGAGAPVTAITELFIVFVLHWLQRRRQHICTLTSWYRFTQSGHR